MNSFRFHFKPGKHGCPEGDVATYANYEQLVLCSIFLYMYQCKARCQQRLELQHTRKNQLQKKHQQQRRSRWRRGTQAPSDEIVHNKLKRTPTTIGQKRYGHVKRVMKWFKQNSKDVRYITKSTNSLAVSKRLPKR